MSMTTEVDLEFDLADRIRKALRVSGLGVGVIAERLEVNRNTIGNWINGHIHPSVQSLYAIATLTGVPFEWLKNGDNPPSSDDPQDDPDWTAFKQWCAWRDSNPQPSDP